MRQDVYVVQIEGTNMYMIAYNAVEYDTLEAAQQTASVVGGGTVGTVKTKA